MGVCCSKKSTVVVAPLSTEIQIGPGLSNGVFVPDKVVASRVHEESLSAECLVLGRHERTLRARQFLPYDAHTMQKPKVSTGQPWTDEAFPLVFEKDRDGKTIQFAWKRPKDFTSDVKPFGKTINRYCAKQGQVSNCFFISTLSAIADYPEYIKQMLPEDAYETEPSKYSGIVHCRFWWMGEWIDVYTDDVLPCSDDWNRYVGVHSDDKNTVWVPLVEKALARLCGSYPQVSGNQMDVFTLMTGGLVEDFKTSKTEESDEYLSPDKLVERVDKALKSGSTALTNISKDAVERQLQGLVSNHAYSVTGTLTIVHRKKVTKLLRIRNPWGEKENTGRRVNDGEWKGRWSYTSTEWKEVDETLQKQHNVHINKGGEFWVCVEDFFKLFQNVYLCDRIPNFARDGFRKEDGLDKVINILGEWHGVTAAGNEEEKKLRNPRFILTIPGQNNAKTMCTVIEITRQFENPTNSADDKNKIFGYIDIYKIEKEEVRDNRLWMSLNKQTVEKSIIGPRTKTYLCKLSPGDHLLVPYYYNKDAKPPVRKSFCIRIFTNVNVKCSQLNEYPTAFYGDWNHPFGDTDNAVCVLNMFGEWKGETAAGYTNNKMKNPKFLLTIPDINRTGQQTTLLLHLRCSRDVKQVPNADIDIFKIEKDQVIDEQLWRSMRKIPKKAESRFLGNCLFKYDLIPGNYILLSFFYDKEALSCEFCLRVLSSTQVQCRHQSENPIMFVRKDEDSLEYGNHGNQSFILDKVDIVFGEWVKNRTAGGNIGKNSFCRNPQFGLFLTGNGNQPVVIALLQESVEPIHAVGCHICQIDEEEKMPVGPDVIRCTEQMKTLDGKTHPYVFSSEAIGRYMLPPGRYLVLVYAEKPTDEKRFALVIASPAQSKITITSPK